MREPDPSVLAKTIGVAIAIAALLAATILSVEHSKTDVAPAPTQSSKVAPPPTLDPRKERRRVENAREDELQDAKSLLVKLNTSLGVLFVRAVQIDHSTLSLTIDGSIWDNERDADKAAINAQMNAVWSDVYNKYNKGGAELRVRLIDVDGTELTPKTN